MATATAATAAAVNDRRLNRTLWGVQVVLALAFAMVGLTKATRSLDALTPMMPWTASVAPALVRLIGWVEFLGAVGVLVPSVTRIKPGVTPIAAVGLALVMVLAAGFHVVRGEAEVLPGNVLLGAMAVFVAWGRTKRVPISPRA